MKYLRLLTILLWPIVALGQTKTVTYSDDANKRIVQPLLKVKSGGSIVIESGGGITINSGATETISGTLAIGSASITGLNVRLVPTGSASTDIFIGGTTPGFVTATGIGAPVRADGPIFINNPAQFTAGLEHYGYVKAVTPAAVPGTLSSHVGYFFETVSGGANLMGYGSSSDLTFRNRTGTIAAQLSGGTLDWQFNSALTVAGKTTTGTLTVGGVPYVPNIIVPSATAITGTVTVGASSANVSGIGTAFVTEAPAGTLLNIANTVRAVQSVTNDAALVLSAVHPGATAVEAVKVPANNLHMDSDGSLTLTTTAGMNLNADAGINTITIGSYLNLYVQNGTLTASAKYANLIGPTNSTGVQWDDVAQTLILTGANGITLNGVMSGNGSGLTTLNGSNVSSGTIAAARLGSGSSITTKFLRGDSTWQTVTSTGDLLSTNNLSDVANASTSRTNLGLAIGTNVQAYDTDLTTYAGITPSANIQTFLGAADYAAMKIQLALTIGTDVQAYDADLSSLAGAAGTNTLYYRSGSGTWSSVSIGTSLSFGGGVLGVTGLAIGSNVQAYDSDLTTWAGITPGANVGTFLATPTKANLNSMVSDDDPAYLGAANTFTTTQTDTQSTDATTVVDGFVAVTSASATSGAQKWSPVFVQEGKGWGTTAGTSQSVKFRSLVKPVQGTVPTGIWVLQGNVAGGAFTDWLTLNTASNGALTTANGIGITATGANITAGGAGAFQWASSTGIFAPSNGTLSFGLNNQSDSAVRLQIGMASGTGLTNSCPSLYRAASSTVLEFLQGNSTSAYVDIKAAVGTFSGATIGSGGTAIAKLKHATAVLVAGTVTVSDSSTVDTGTAATSSRIFVDRFTDAGTIGTTYSITRSNGTSFTITSTNPLDTSTVSWLMINP